MATAHVRIRARWSQKAGVLMESRKSLFVVIRRYGPPYDPQKPLEAQLDWEGHRLFMNALEAEGLARLAGPLEGTTEVLLVFRADSENEIDERLKADPWTRSGILSTSRIARWEPTARRGGVESSHDSPLEGGSIEAQRRNGLLLTRRWREMNSNFRFRDRQAKWRRMRYGFSCSTTERLLGLTLAGDDLSGLPKTFPATHHVDNGSDVRASPTGMPALYPRP